MVIREAIDNYTLDKLETPKSLQDLVEAGYIREIPVDPMTQKADWTITLEDAELSSGQKVAGIVDIHSRSSEVGKNGMQYNAW